MTAKKKSDSIPKELLELARAKAAVSPTWADFANYLFNPHNGLITSPFRRIVRRLRIERAIHRFGLVDVMSPVVSSD